MATLWSHTPCLVVLLTAACAHKPTPAASEARQASAVMRPTAGHDGKGQVTFVEKPEGVEVTAELEGLTPGDHGFHVHETGDCSAADASSAGPHFNPAGHPHGLPEANARHVGDMGNVTAAADGTARVQRLLPGATLDGPQGLRGRAVIVHANPDDGAQPAGNAGARVSCGVIQP